MTDDLVQFLTACLDEDERIARAAGHLSGSLSGGVPDVGERWRVSGSHADDGGTYWSITTASPDLDRIPTVEMVGSGMSGGGAHTEEVAEHIAAHDPARVLREIEAKRRILAAHEREPMPKGDSADCAQCWGAVWPCSTLRLLALPFADRPGYQEGWAP